MRVATQIQSRPTPRLFSGRVASRAVAFWLPAYYSPGIDALTDLTGNGLHARLGSSVGPDTNDPLRLSFAGQRYVYFSGVPGNFLSTPSIPITGDIELIFRMSSDTWTPVESTVLNKWTEAGNQRSWLVQIPSNGRIYFASSANGSTLRYNQATAAVPASAGETIWLRFTRVAASGVAAWYWQPDQENVPVSWTQLGSTLNGTAGAILGGTAPLVIGAFNNGTSLMTSPIRVHYFEARASIGGPAVARFDAAGLREPFATITGGAGEVWTLNRSATGRKLCAVDRPLLLLGSDDFLSVPDSPLLNAGAADSFTAVAFLRRYGGNPAAAQYVMRKSAGGPRWSMELSASATCLCFVSDGTNSGAASVARMADGVASFYALARNKGAGAVLAQIAGDRQPGTDNSGTLSNAAALRIGAHEAGTNFLDAEYLGGGFFRQSLTLTDLRDLAREVGIAA